MCKPACDQEKTTASSSADSKNLCGHDAVGKNSSISSAIDARRSLANGTLVSCISIFFLICGLSLTFPQMQSRRDELGCDALCYGSMTSFRGAIGLVGTAVIGRLSDRNDSFLAKSFGSVGKGGGSSGRRGCLVLGIIASLVGCIIAVTMNSLLGLWLSMIPGAFLQHNFDVFKALLSEYHNDIDDADNCEEESPPTTSRSNSVGKLGMTVGISFMIGPSFAAVGVGSTFQSATYIATFCILLSGAAIFFLPLPASTKNHKTSNSRETQQQKNEFTLSKMIKLQTSKTRAAMTLLVIRFTMAIAFHVFNTIWPASLKARFNFGPSDHARFMSYIGITYAVSQGFVAKRMISALGAGGKVYGIMLCCLLLGVGRYIAFHTESLSVVYASFLFIINALGVLNTVITADTGSIAPSNEIGSLFGLLQASESAAGMAGPFIGGMVSHYLGKDAPLVAVVAIYTFLFFFVSWGYDGLVLSAASSHDERKETKKKVM